MEHPGSRPSGPFVIGVRSSSSQVSTAERDESEEKQNIGQKSKLMNRYFFSPSIQPIVMPLCHKMVRGPSEFFSFPSGLNFGGGLWPANTRFPALGENHTIRPAFYMPRIL